MENIVDKKSDNFEEVETTLEKMFAGIEDENSEREKETNNLEENDKGKQDVSEIAKCLTQELESKDPTIDKKDSIIDQHLQTNKTKKQGENVSKKKKPAKRDAKLFKPMVKTEKKKNNEVSKKDENNGKIKGPYIQIKSNNTILVNNSSSEEYIENKAKKGSSNSVKNEINKLRGLYVSTLSTKYDADTTDASWLCVFCKKGPHKLGLGDLYGPYIIQSAGDCGENGEIKSTNAVTNIKTKRKNEKIESPKHILSTGMLQVSENSFEIWCHEDCIIWAAGVYLIGLKVIGLENAVWSSNLNECSQCMLNGAIICCLSRGCSKKSHFPCAKINKWVLDETNFKTYCPDHKIF
ncbi:uncharacterized protein CG5098 [Condylostylus longicornis]|uniref:uncharacterized protein CG5098 n=1 Tax=Condylostylus longicornis TaxID=2530218 RepID=UPI00244E2C57|nr:uncharacterized protein CG5098 [Condylostylus longicornis]